VTRSAVQDWFDRLQGQPLPHGGIRPGTPINSALAAALAQSPIIRPEMGTAGAFRAPQINATYRPIPPAPNPPERPALGVAPPGPVSGGARSLNYGGQYRAAGLQKLGQGIEQALGDIGEQIRQQKALEATKQAYAAIPALPPLPPPGARPNAPAAAPPPRPIFTQPGVSGGQGTGTFAPLQKSQAAATTALLPDAAKKAVSLAAAQQGVNSAAIGDYLHNGGNNLDPQTNAWCAAFVDSTLRQVGMPQLADGLNRNVATNYARWGEPETPGQVQPGDVVVNTRGLNPGETGGHVGIATGAPITPGGGIPAIAGNAPGRRVAGQTFPAGSIVRAPPDSVQDYLQDNPGVPATASAYAPMAGKMSDMRSGAGDYTASRWPTLAEAQAYGESLAPKYGIGPGYMSGLVGKEYGYGAARPVGGTPGAPAYGPMQLRYPGMGSDFTKATGLDARDPANWQQAMDFAASRIPQTGWSPWAPSQDKLGWSDREGIGAPQAQQFASTMPPLPPLPPPVSLPQEATPLSGTPREAVQSGPADQSAAMQPSLINGGQPGVYSASSQQPPAIDQQSLLAAALAQGNGAPVTDPFAQAIATGGAPPVAPWVVGGLTGNPLDFGFGIDQ
jgi:hypothetical protein